MKRYIRSSEGYPRLHGELPVQILYHSQSDTSSDVQIKLSYKTAFLYIDDENVCSFYPKPGDSPDYWSMYIKEICQDNDCNISDERANELAIYMIDNIHS